MSLGNKEVMAQNIKYYMKKYNIDRNKLCFDLNLKYMTVSDWINAKTYPRIDKIETLANYFKISKSDLVEKRKNDEAAFSKTLQSIIDTSTQLHEDRQQVVLDTAKKQLKEQNRKSNITNINEIKERSTSYVSNNTNITEYGDIDLYGGISAGT
ncbi:helix-turn-helix transcriptional regulator, partial [Granulicatella sp. 19428wC4_WM01]